MREKNNIFQGSVSEASVKFIAKAEAKRSNKERAYADARANAGSEIKEKRRRRGKQWRQGRKWRLIMRRGKEDGPEPNQGIRHRFTGLLTSIDGKYLFYIATK